MKPRHGGHSRALARLSFRIVWSFPLVALLASACGPAPGVGDVTGGPTWEASKRAALADLIVHRAWAAPELLGPEINTAGWEDGANITLDGSRLSFAYFQGDLQGFVEGGLKDFPAHQRGPDRGATPPGTIDVFESTLGPSGTWSEPTKFKYDEDLYAEGGVFYHDASVYHMSNHTSNHETDLFENGVALTAVNTHSNEDDPHYARTAAYGEELFFWSAGRGCDSAGDRASCRVVGDKDIWVARKANGAWAAPNPVSAPLNSDGADMQPHLRSLPDGRQVMYFASGRGGRGLEILRAERTGADAWSTPEAVIGLPAGPSGVVAVGEPTLTASGDLYFVVIFKDRSRRLDCDIARARAVQAPS